MIVAVHILIIGALIAGGAFTALWGWARYGGERPGIGRCALGVAGVIAGIALAFVWAP